MNNEFIEYDTYDTSARRSVGTEGGRMAAVNVWRHYEGRSRLGDGGEGRFGVAGACDLGRGPAADATLQTAVTKTCDPLDAAE